MFSIRPLPQSLSKMSFVTLIVTWLHSGRIKPASGTWGTLAAMPFIWIIWQLGGGLGLTIFAIMSFSAGLWAIPRYTSLIANDDPSEVVLDEVIGIALTFVPLIYAHWSVWIVGFAAFRLFDAVKVGPVGWCDRHFKGAWGVMLDDVVAGIFAAFCVYGYQRLI